MKELARKECSDGAATSHRLEGDELTALLGRLGHQWEITEAGHLLKTFDFANFAEALAFVNQVGEIAEAQNHHPDLQLRWGQAVVEIWTHSVGGLTEGDFILAAKTECLER
jgi:4a-hydroxytetrahydrobiopterin dehydratase